MSLVDIHIQMEDFSTQNAIYDEINMQMPDDDQIELRCGEVFISRRREIIFLCTECREIFNAYNDYFSHICEKHLTMAENEIKCEDIEEPADIIDARPGPILEPNQDETNTNNQTNPLEISRELLDSFETLDSYEVLEEPEDHNSIAYLSDYTKFIEKVKDKEYLIDEPLPESYSNLSDISSAETFENNVFHTTSTSPSTVYQCNVCHKSFQSEIKLQSHQKYHTKERKYKCTICGFAFTEVFNLRAHIRRHNGVKPHACNICGKRFTTSNEVKAHLRSHTGERPYICEVCGQTYATSGSLNEHKKRHTNYRPHKCQLCPKTFYDSGLLKEHMVMHTGERNHVCDVCEATFTRRKALQQHAKLHSGVKEYKCSVCDKAFAQKPGLASHLKTHKNLLNPIKKEPDEE